MKPARNLEQKIWLALCGLAILLALLIKSIPAPTEVVFTPNDKAADKLIGLVNNAKKSVWITQYDFQYYPLGMALIDAYKRGVDVRLISQAYFDEVDNEKKNHGKPYKVMNRLVRNNVPVRIAIPINGHKFNIHNKYMIVDGKILQAGSLNFTWKGIHDNYEDFLIIRDNPELISIFVNHYTKLWEKTAEYKRQSRPKLAAAN
jgi:phosphatidylserine/phosphatidylglycerophosphate/cardiolipin synthase-like enzyme